MECDWEYELGSDAPVIDAHWEGFVDLRAAPQRATELSEAVNLPALAAALVRLNGSFTQLFTSKCDVWRVEDPGSVDSDELDALRESCSVLVACYIDLQPNPDRAWTQPHHSEEWCRSLCACLRAIPLRQCRVDFVIRAAVSASQPAAFAVTTYITACGVIHQAALDALSAALDAVADAILRCPSPPPSDQSYNGHTGE